MADGSRVRFCCEVARREHVELCLSYGIDTIWLGARTTANPFMVEEISNALNGTGIQVLVKNPMSPDVRLWIGAIERLRQAGINQIAAVHRGFYMYNNLGYRNAPLWEVAMELRRELPDIPIICDPSHMGGRRDLVETLALHALQLDYDGLMVEVHPNPDQAWTDAQQQLSPTEFTRLLSTLSTLAPHNNADALPSPILSPLRAEIDAVDHELLRLLSRRMQLSRQIATVKRSEGLTVYQAQRWNAVVRDRLLLAADLGLDATFTKELLERIHSESVRIQIEEE